MSSKLGLPEAGEGRALTLRVWTPRDGKVPPSYISPHAGRACSCHQGRGGRSDAARAAGCWPGLHQHIPGETGRGSGVSKKPAAACSGSRRCSETEPWPLAHLGTSWILECWQRGWHLKPQQPASPRNCIWPPPEQLASREHQDSGWWWLTSPPPRGGDARLASPGAASGVLRSHTPHGGG